MSKIKEVDDLNTLSGLIARANRVMGKKLPTENKEKLNESVFCGKELSFPVIDCDHAAVSKAYLGKSKFSKATKKQIVDNINKRAKKLKCTVNKKIKANVEELPKFIELSYKQKQLYSSDIFNSTKELVNKHSKK